MDGEGKSQIISTHGIYLAPLSANFNLIPSVNLPQYFDNQFEHTFGKLPDTLIQHPAAIVYLTTTTPCAA